MFITTVLLIQNMNMWSRLIYWREYIFEIEVSISVPVGSSPIKTYRPINIPFDLDLKIILGKSENKRVCCLSSVPCESRDYPWPQRWSLGVKSFIVLVVVDFIWGLSEKRYLLQDEYVWNIGWQEDKVFVHLKESK